MSNILILLGIMIVEGLVIGWVAGLIWKGNRPIGAVGDTIVAVVSVIVIALLDWYVIPAMGFSDTMKLLGVALEPPLGALLVLWIIRKARS
jgi:uncharacterized membrane protein YeaQ/YmgE (transglycosylase-associated protein family)